MNRQQKIRLVEEHDETFWLGDLDDLDRQLSPAFVDHSAPLGTPPGPGSVRTFAEAARSWSPGTRVVIDEAIVEGNVVVVRATWRGPRSEDGPSSAGGDGEIVGTGIVIWELDDEGRILRRHAQIDGAPARAAMQGAGNG